MSASPDELPEWIPGAAVENARWRDRSAYSQAERRELFSRPPGTPQACRKGLVGRGATSVRGKESRPAKWMI